MLTILYWIIFGSIVGFIADLIDKKHSGGLLVNIIVGILGAVVGGWIAGILGPLVGFRVSEGFNILNIAFSVVGALVVLAIYRTVSSRE